MLRFLRVGWVISFNKLRLLKCTIYQYTAIQEKNYCKKRNRKVVAPGLVCNNHGKIDDVLKLIWFPAEDRLCMNTAKLAYKGLHGQIFPYQLN